ncbi:hypothetical protein AMTRI_Chr12g238090 [Amborella trichopoda]
MHFLTTRKTGERNQRRYCRDIESLPSTTLEREREHHQERETTIVDAACLAGNPSLPPTPPMAQARTNFPATFPTKPNFPLTIPAKIQRALTTSGLHRLMEFFLSIERSTPRGRRCIKLTASI